jgi:hypothetical protein
MKMPLPFSTALLVSVVSMNAAEPVTFIELPYRYVIGGHANGKWLDTENAGKTIQPGTDFRICTLKGEQGKLTVKKSAPMDDVCMDIWMAETDAESDMDLRGVAIAADWNPMPRAVKAGGTTLEVYVNAVGEVLITQGIRKPVVKITQHLRVDLNGDGEDEVLLSATHYPAAEGEGSAPTSAGEGNYSFTALRRLIGGKVVTQILEGEFYERATEFSAPNVHEVGAVLDLDGDGKMEIVLHSQYYEGGATTVWQLGAKEAKRVLEIACGV